MIKQKLPVFHNTSPKVLAFYSRCWSWENPLLQRPGTCLGQLITWPAVTVTVPGQLCHQGEFPLPPSPAPGMAQAFQQLHDLHSPRSKTTGRTKPVQTASACGNPSSGVPHVIPKKAQFPFLCCNSSARLQKPGPKFIYQFGKMCSHHILCQYL